MLEFLAGVIILCLNFNRTPSLDSRKSSTVRFHRLSAVACIRLSPFNSRPPFFPSLIIFFLHCTGCGLAFLLTIIFAFIGEYDHLPEVAFYMVSDISEAVAKAERLAEEVQ